MAAPDTGEIALAISNACADAGLTLPPTTARQLANRIAGMYGINVVGSGGSVEAARRFGVGK